MRRANVSACQICCDGTCPIAGKERVRRILDTQLSLQHRNAGRAAQKVPTTRRWRLKSRTSLLK